MNVAGEGSTDAVGSQEHLKYCQGIKVRFEADRREWSILMLILGKQLLNTIVSILLSSIPVAAC